jgi:hypothetical protein
MSDEQVDRDLDEMTGDPAITRQLKSSLQRLRSGAAGPGLADMARDVLEGRATLRDAVRNPAYASAMTNVMGRLEQWNADLTDQQRHQLVEDAKAQPHDDGGTPE